MQALSVVASRTRIAAVQRGVAVVAVICDAARGGAAVHGRVWDTLTVVLTLQIALVSWNAIGVGSAISSELADQVARRWRRDRIRNWVGNRIWNGIRNWIRNWVGNRNRVGGWSGHVSRWIQTVRSLRLQALSVVTSRSRIAAVQRGVAVAAVVCDAAH